jgi:hypothetical protein
MKNDDSGTSTQMLFRYSEWFRNQHPPFQSIIFPLAISLSPRAPNMYRISLSVPSYAKDIPNIYALTRGRASGCIF